jgi:hypothetical protein
MLSLGEDPAQKQRTQVVQIQIKSVLDNQSKKKLGIEKTLNSLFSLLTCMRKQTAPIQKTPRNIRQTAEPNCSWKEPYNLRKISKTYTPTLTLTEKCKMAFPQYLTLQPEQHLVTSNN